MLLFLLHVPSAIIPIITIPVAVLISFLPFRALGITANIMSLGGIAIAMGELVDAAIVVVEQTHKKLEERQKSGQPVDHHAVVIEAVKEVAPASFYALLVIAVSFLPVLTLEAQEGRLFKPLAYTKTLAMIVAACLAITLDPALRLVFTRFRNFDFQPTWLCRLANTVFVGRIHSEDKHPVSRFLIWLYEPVVRWSLRWKWSIVAGALVAIIVTVPVFMRLGSEFMPPLDEGALFYMPTTMPGISISEAQKLTQVTNRIIKQFPEVDRVLGKAGRADTSTDPAPLSMLETVITLKPQSEWRRVDTWYSGWAPEWLKPVFRPFTSDRISQEELVNQLDEAVKLPGVSNAWTMPIKARIDMLTTGIRTPLGLKVTGDDLAEDRGDRDEDRVAAALGSRHAQRVRRAHGRRVLPRHRVEPRRAGALRPERRGGPGGRAERDRRRERHHHRRGARALPGERPVHARLPVGFRLAQPRAGARVGRPAADPARPAGDDQGGHRPGDDPQRGRPAHRLRVRGRGRPRPGELRRGSRRADPREGEAAAGLRGAVERAVRGDGARPRSGSPTSCR